jgi:hypothetical protein
MWSEHCSYKSSKVHLKQFGEKAVKSDALLVGIGENAGVVDVGQGYAVTFKIESHNHPSFIEPYQGAATGVGGIVRDIQGEGILVGIPLERLHDVDRNQPNTVSQHLIAHRGAIGRDVDIRRTAILTNVRAKCHCLYIGNHGAPKSIRIPYNGGVHYEADEIAILPSDLLER